MNELNTNENLKASVITNKYIPVKTMPDLSKDPLVVRKLEQAIDTVRKHPPVPFKK